MLAINKGLQRSVFFSLLPLRSLPVFHFSMIDFYSCVALFSCLSHTLRVKNFIWSKKTFPFHSTFDFVSHKLSFKLYFDSRYISVIHQIYFWRINIRTYNPNENHYWCDWRCISFMIVPFKRQRFIFYMKFLRPLSLSPVVSRCSIFSSLPSRCLSFRLIVIPQSFSTHQTSQSIP